MKKSFTWKLAVGLAIVVALPLGCSCRQKIADKAIEKAIETQAKKDGKDVDVKMDTKAGTMSIKAKDGSENVNVDMKSDGNSFSIKTQDGVVLGGENAKIPDSFPKDVPVFPGAKPTLVTTDTKSEMFSVSLTTADTFENVGTYYKKELAANGWKEEQTMTQSGDQPMQMLTYTKENRSVMVTITRDGANTALALMVSKSGS